jgi:hypothetical protein
MVILAVALVMWLAALVLMMGLCSAAAAGDRRLAAEIEDGRRGDSHAA